METWFETLISLWIAVLCGFEWHQCAHILPVRPIPFAGLDWAPFHGMEYLVPPNYAFMTDVGRHVAQIELDHVLRATLP